ncbi:MAG: hypothetical protein H6744_19830 [Deltaproteobacteria bacterium]|nr:hypothetical protein [Deltaproteobacteria bacterium]
MRVALALGLALLLVACGEAGTPATVSGPALSAPPRLEPAALGGVIVFVDGEPGGALRAVDATLGPDAPAVGVFQLAEGARASSPVVRREPLAVDAPEIFMAVAAGGACTLRAFTRTLAPAWSRALAGTCVQPAVAGASLLWPVSDADGARVERLDAMTGAPLGEAALPGAAVAPAARLGDGSARWVLPLSDGAAVVDASAPGAPALIATLALPDLALSSVLAPGGEHVVFTARAAAGADPGGLGDRLQRARVTAAGALEPVGEPILTPVPMEAAPVGAAPGCQARTGGSHWWCGGGGFVATGGSHWLGGYDLTTGAVLFDVETAEATVESLSLGGDGRLYTGGSHWLGGFELRAFDPALAPDPSAFQLVLSRPEMPAAFLPSVAFTCGRRTAALVDPAAGAAELVLTDAEAVAAPPGTWARAFGGGDNAGHAAGGDACVLSAPAQACGDGVLDPGEACDDGNTTDEPLGAVPTCSADCRVQRELVSAAVPLPLSGLVSGPLAPIRSIRVRYVSGGVRVYGELCVPPGPGPYPVMLAAFEGYEPLGHPWASELCSFAASQGTIAAFTQARGRGQGTDWPSEGRVEICRGEVDDLRGLAELARALPEADPARVGAFGAGFGACTVTRLASLGADPQATPPWPGVGAVVLGASVTDAGELYARHAQDPPPVAASGAIVAALEQATAGSPDAAPVAYALRSPALDAEALWEAGTAVMLVHATGDPLAPVAQACELRAALIARGATFFDAQVSATAPAYLPAELVPAPACPGMDLATADPAWAGVDFAFFALQDTGTYDLTQLGMLAVVDRMVRFLEAHANQ